MVRLFIRDNQLAVGRGFEFIRQEVRYNKGDAQIYLMLTVRMIERKGMSEASLKCIKIQ